MFFLSRSKRWCVVNYMLVAVACRRFCIHIKSMCNLTCTPWSNASGATVHPHVRALILFTMYRPVIWYRSRTQVFPDKIGVFTHGFITWKIILRQELHEAKLAAAVCGINECVTYYYADVLKYLKKTRNCHWKIIQAEKTVKSIVKNLFFIKLKFKLSYNAVDFSQMSWACQTCVARS